MCGLKLVTASGPISAGPFPVGQLAKSVTTGQEPVLPPADVAAGDTTYVAGGNVNLNVGERKRRDTSLAARLAREDSIVTRSNRVADSLRAEAARARAKGDTAVARRLTSSASWYASRSRLIERRREGCAHDTAYYAGSVLRFDGKVRMTVRVPCDTSHFATSPDLPRSIYDEGEEVVGSTERDILTRTLNMGLQASWAPRPPELHTGLDLLRYNRIEGLSVGASATSELGRGYTAHAIARIGTADLVPNGELTLQRSNGRDDLRLGAYHRLDVANDDWGSPLSPGASLANLLYARDEGFYYRSYGAEVAGVRHAPILGASVRWRLLGERERGAGRNPNTQVSFANLFANPRFVANIDATQVTALGARVELARSFGVNPAATHLDSRLRLEGAFTDRGDTLGGTGYGRLLIDQTLAFPFGPLSAAVTGAAGTSGGDVPIQRAFFVGGLQTVRGQRARADSVGRVGDAMWLVRGELGLTRSLALKPALFYDIGWAGARSDFARPGRPLSGAGIGLSMLDGLFRLDVSRGIWPERRWRIDTYIGARF